MTNKINKVRFAPSPTGQVHIGNIRTAIFNWLYARHTGAEFLLRIEDTDIERSTSEAINTLLECMEWLGIDYDGTSVYQTQMRDSHLSSANHLVRKGLAYHAESKDSGSPAFFRIPWECADCSSVRDAGEAFYDLHPNGVLEIGPNGITFSTVAKSGKPIENSACLAGFRHLKALDAGGKVIFELEKHIDEVLKEQNTFNLENVTKITFLRREVFFKDMVKGEMSKPLDSMKDLVIVRSDGTPIFHLANVCDDITQEITHIIRGDDHVENTYRHLLLFYALGANAPSYGHLPMIINSSGKPFSKRDGDAFVGEFREKGFLPEALYNYLVLLGWSPGDDLEKMTRQQMIEKFTLERVKSAPAQFDINKLLNMNGIYIAELFFEEFMTNVRKFADPSWDSEQLEKVAALMQSRTKIFSQISDWSYFFQDDFELDMKSFAKQYKKPEIRATMKTVAEKLHSVSDFTAENIHLAIEEIAVKSELGGKLFQAIRLAISGVAGGAELDFTMQIIGRERCVKNIEHALQIAEKQFF